MLKEQDRLFATDLSSLDYIGGRSASQPDIINSPPLWKRPEAIFDWNQLSEEEWEKFRQKESRRLENLITNPEDQIFMMRGTGFDVITQVVSLNEEYLKSLSEGKTFEESKHKFSEQIKEDLRCYFWEFVQKEPVLKIDLELEEIDGTTEVITPKYNRKRLVDTVNSTEREGATKLGIINLASCLSTNENGTYAIASPKGWSGFWNEKGAELLFPESQLYVYIKSDDQLQGYTFRNDLTLSELQQFAKEQLKPSNIYDSESGQIKDLVSTVLKFDSETGVKDVLDQIQQIKGTEVLWTEKSSGKKWLFEEALHKVNSTRDIWETNKIVDNLISSTPALVESLEDLSDKELSRLIVSLGKIALQIRRASKIEADYQVTSISQGPNGIIMSHTDYINEAAQAQKDQGCIFQEMVNSPFGMTGLVDETADAGDGKGPLIFRCSKGHRNQRPLGGTIPNCTTCGENVGC